MKKGLVVLLLLASLAACGGQGAAGPTATPQPTPLSSGSYDPELLARYFQDIYLWQAPSDRPATEQDMLNRSETFAVSDKKIGIAIHTTPEFKPGMKVIYRLDKRAYQGEGTPVFLDNLITSPGQWNLTVDSPGKSGDYVLRFYLDRALVYNATFSLK